MSNGSPSKFISLQQAVEMTTRYRQNKDRVINSQYAGMDILALCDKFDRTTFDTLLEKTDCSAIRIYYGMDESLKIHPVVVAVNESDEDILPDSSLGSNLEVEDDDIGDDALRCPPYCPPPSPLNE